MPRPPSTHTLQRALRRVDADPTRYQIRPGELRRFLENTDDHERETIILRQVAHWLQHHGHPAAIHHAGNWLRLRTTRSPHADLALANID